MGSADRYEALERRARDAEARLDAVLKAAVDAIVMIDERGRVLLFGAAAERMFGWEAREVLGRNVSMLMPEPFRSGHDGYLHHYLETGSPRIIGIGREVVALRKDGTQFPVELSVGEIASFGEGRRFVGLIRDVTAKVRAEAEAREHRERLAHVTRLSTLGEMAAGIAHEINQPLTAIASYAQALARQMRSDPGGHPERRDTVERIAEQALRAGEILRRLRDFARKGEDKRVPCDLGEAIRDALRLAEVAAQRHEARVEVQVPERLPRVVADSIQLQQVILNLVRNALEAMDAVPRSRRRLLVAAARQGDRVEVSVTDSGPGVEERAQPQLFHPFFTTKRQGMGMGLSISHSIVTAHGGALSWAPNPEGGATFRFTLPLAGGRDGSATAAGGGPAEAGGDRPGAAGSGA